MSWLVVAAFVLYVIVRIVANYNDRPTAIKDGGFPTPCSPAQRQVPAPLVVGDLHARGDQGAKAPAEIRTKACRP